MAVDQHDAYWILRHRVLDGDWPPTEELVADIVEMVRPDLAVYSDPSARHCPPCPYLEPCLALREGRAAAVQRAGRLTRVRPLVWPP